MSIRNMLELLKSNLNRPNDARNRRRAVIKTATAFIDVLEPRMLLSAINPLQLSSLDGTNGFRLDGIDFDDWSGGSVSDAGDVNGDGFDDVIIGAHRGDAEGDYSGESYVVFGRSGGFASALDLSSLNGSNGFRLDGINAYDGSGFSVSSAGDVNGDGFADLIVGATRGRVVGNLIGESYVVFGKSGSFAESLDLSSLNGSNGFRLDGVSAGDLSGYSVSSAGDVNGDGFDDVIIGGSRADAGSVDSGESYVVFGKSGGFASSIDLSSLDGSIGFRLNGIDAEDLSGHSVSSGGDVNGDGFDDLIIGAFRADAGDVNSGESYVVFGKSGGFASSIDLSSLNGTTGFRLDGTDAFDYAGRSVNGAGDLNGDGFDDLIIGVDRGNNGAGPSGESYVVFGKSGGFASAIDLSSLNGNTGFRLDGIDAGDESGISVSKGGDVNGDGFDDLIIGAYRADAGGHASGESYVIFGKSGSFASPFDLSDLNGSTGFRIDGISDDDFSGRSVSAAGDVNGDGFDDVIIGARGADPGGSYSGASYVVFGGNFTGGAETQVGNASANPLNAVNGTGLDVLIGGGGNDTLVSDGGPDVLLGGEGNDTLAISDVDFSSTRRLVGGTGINTLRMDGSGQTLDLTAIPDNRITDFNEIDITGTGPNTLTLNALEVLNISSHSNTLVVRRNSQGIVNFGSGWSNGANEVIGGKSFAVYTQGAATLKVQISVDPPIVSNSSTLVNTQTTSGLVINANPADNPDVTYFKITDITGGTLFQNDGTTPINNGDFITVAQGNAGLKFTPAQNSAVTGHFTARASTGNVDSGLGDDSATADIAITLSKPSVTVPAVDLSLRPAISWSAVPGATGYEVWIDNVSTNTSPFHQATTSGTSYTPSVDLGIGQFRVWVRALAGDGVVSAWSQVQYFKILTPVALNSLNPQQSTFRPTLTWDTLPGADHYDVWIDNVSTGVSQILRNKNVASSPYTVSADLPVGNYLAWVRGIAKDGLAATWSSVAFSVVVAPTITQGQNAAFDRTPVIKWNPLPGAHHYDVWINNLSTGVSQVVRNTNVTSTTFTGPDTLPIGNYRVWVRGITTDGYPTAWSSAVNFSINGAPTVTQGQNSTFDNTPVFAWNALPGAVKYEVFVQNLSTGATTIDQKNITGLQITPTASLNDGPYRWWVRAETAQGFQSLWSAPMDISIGGQTKLVAPTGTTTDTTPTFTWQKVDGVGRYDLWVDKVGGQSQIIRQQSLTTTSFTASTALSAGTYRAWIRAIATTGQTSLWSQVVEFIIT